ncbi:MAG: InlB B-repeat-containing protein, partial [Clostridia bacterium]|nr:InlB B-repeat-containing protein [Clostridia bacterium]
MNKLKKWLVAFTAIIAVAFSFAAIGCKKSKNVTLTYDVGGGTEIAAVSAVKGTEVELATTAEKEGYEFAGWYLSADYSDEKVTKITLDADTTVYAKWGKLYLVSIVAEGGTATPASVYVKAGEVLLTKLESVSAQKTDCKFGEWQVDGKTVTSSYVMPEKDITVNAKFMTKYTVEIYREGADGNYVKDAEPTVDYAYAGTTPDKNFAGEGYELVKNASGSKPISAIKETASENNFVLYYKRMDLSVTFRPNYPADAEHGSSVGESKKIKYGEEVAVPYDYTAEGYYLAGWSTKTVDATVEYAADYIYNKLYDKTGATPVNAKVAPSSDVVLYGVWVKGYRDMFGGKDYLFVSKTEENTVYMSRENYFFKGRIFGENGTKFLFRLSNNDTLEGRFLENEFFAYQHVENVVYTYFKIGTGIQKGTTIKLDAYNGIDYHSGDSVSSGTYEIDDNGVYVVTYSSGDLAGKTAMLFLTQTTLNGVNTNVYLERDEEEYGFGLLATYGVVNGSPAQYTLSVRLNGFGNAGLYINNVYRGAYTYSLDKTTGLLTISKVGTYLLTDYNGNKVLFNYDSDEVKTYTSTNGKITVSTDGAGRATLSESGATSTGYYNIATSVLGGEILTFTSGSASRVFLTSSVKSEGEKGETVTTYTLEEKAA